MSARRPSARRSAPIRIRIATARDRARWGPLRHALWPDCSGSRNAAEMRIFLADPKRYVTFLAERADGSLAGFLEVSLRPNYRAGVHPPIGYLEGLYVEAEDRRRGIGGALVREAERWARAQGCIEMGSDAAPTNRGSRAAHRSYGYRERERLIVFHKRISLAPE